jgi:hypothetical protein
MGQPFAKFNVLRLCRQSEEVALDRALCISLIQELLGLFDICVLLAKGRGDGGRVCQMRKRRSLLRDW